DNSADGGENFLHRRLLCLCGLAHCWFGPSSSPPGARVHLRIATNQSPRDRVFARINTVYSRERTQYGESKFVRKNLADVAPATSTAIAVAQRPSGVRTPTQLSRIW